MEGEWTDDFWGKEEWGVWEETEHKLFISLQAYCKKQEKNDNKLSNSTTQRVRKRATGKAQYKQKEGNIKN